MSIMELDEAEGLTAEMVRGYMLAKGWTFRNLLMDGSEDAIAPVGEPGFARAVIPCRWPSHLWIVGRVVDHERRSPQAILREMNPRMRGPGYPSLEAVKAHGPNGGWWLFMHSDGDMHTARAYVDKWGSVKFYWENGLMGEPQDENCMWWPCDAHGNKVLWPATKEGVR